MAYKQVLKPELTANDSSAQAELGSPWGNGSNGKEYKYVQVVDTAVANGDVVEFASTSGTVVTQDRSGGSSVGRAVAGVAVGTISKNYYGYIQTRGRHTAVKVPAGVAISAGAALVPHSSTDGGCITATASSTATNTEGQRFAFALGADTATTSAAGVVIADLGH